MNREPKRGPSSRPPKRKSPRKRSEAAPRVSGALVWSLLGLAAVVAVFATFLLVVYPETKGPGTGRDVELVIPGDESSDVLAGRIAAAGLVTRPEIFRLFLRASGASARIARGAHLLTDDLSPSELLRRLERKGTAARVKVTLPEGFTRFDIAKRVQSAHIASAAQFLAATTDPALLKEMHLEGESAEGVLFPATYDFVTDTDAKEVVRRLKGEFDKRWATLVDRHQSELKELADTLGWSPRQILILASMVEKEAREDEERPIIASVFLNRLRDPNFKRKVLQCDPTSGYGCLVHRDRIPSCAEYTGKITHDINVDPANDYSTYVHEGLPPGPISNPGMKSLSAALSPANTKYLYFVARGEGRHTFSETYEAHDTAVKQGRSH